MEKNYRLYTKGGIAYNFNRFQKDSLLTIGLMDMGTKEQLETEVSWYHENMKGNLFVVTYERRFSSLTFQDKYSDVVYIIFKQETDLASRVNAIAAECTSSYFYVTRSDASTIAEPELFRPNEIFERFNRSATLVAQAPLIVNKFHEFQPTVREPKPDGKMISIVDSMPENVEENTLTPYLGLGFYNRTLFQRIRGFDTEIKSGYWQVVDFGIRCYLYGYRILSVLDAALIFQTRTSLMEDCSECQGIERVYTKALGIYMDRHGNPRVKKSYRTDKKVLISEVKPRSGLYKTDYKTLCAFWKK